MFSKSQPSTVLSFSPLNETLDPQTPALAAAISSSLNLIPLPIRSGSTRVTATDLGILTGQSTTRGEVDSVIPQAFYQFQLTATSDLSLTLNELSADANLYLAQDMSSDGGVDAIDIIAQSTTEGTTPEVIRLTGLEPGNYFVEVTRSSCHATYNLTLTVDAAGNTWDTACNLGNLQASQNFSDFVGSSDPEDLYRFSLDSTSNFRLSLSGLSADADIYLVQDSNGDGALTFDELVASSMRAGNSPEAIAVNNLVAGDYAIWVSQFSGDTNYRLQITTTPVVNLQVIEGSLNADTFTYDPSYQYTVVSGKGNVDFGNGSLDLLDLSNLPSSSISLNLANLEGGGVLFDSGHGTRVFDDLILSNGNQILFEGIDRVRFADRTLDLAITPNDPLFSQQWNLTIAGVQTAWRFTTGSSSVLIGIEDTGLGIDYFGNVHPDLRPSIVIDSNLADEFNNLTSHGTSVEGIISAIPNNGVGLSGINWRSPIAQIDVIPGNDLGDRNLTQATEELIAQAATQGQRLVINLSLTHTPEPAFEELVASHPDDVLFVIASGNGYDSSLDYPAYLSNFYSNVVAVGAAFGKDDGSGQPVVLGTRAPYSNYGYGLTLMGPTNVVTTSALGFDYANFFDYTNQVDGLFNGTSAATPNVTGIASLVWSANPNLTATQVRQVLSETAYDLGIPGYDLVYGYGLVNADTAVRRAIALSRAK